jgi:hypothetical protein
MKYAAIHIALALLILWSCSKSDLTYSDLPGCIKDQIDSGILVGVLVQEFHGELHYRLQEALIDSDELIVNDKCETQCYFGGWIHPDCLEDYEDHWVVIWTW